MAEQIYSQSLPMEIYFALARRFARRDSMM